MNTAAPAWKMERDAEGIVWLTLDKPGSSTNVLGRAILEELGGLVDQIAANRAEGRGDPLGQAERLHCRRGHQGVHRLQERDGRVRPHPRRPARVRAPRSAALPHGRGHSGLRARRRAGAGARVPLSRGRGRRALVAWPARSAARHSSGFRRHRAHGAPHRHAAPRWK